MNTKILGLLAAALLVGPIVANAQYSLIYYQGAPLTIVSYTPLIIPAGDQITDGIIPFIGPYLATGPISGFIGLDTPLPVNGTDAGDGEFDIGGLGLPVTSAEFETTNGVLTSWSVSAGESNFSEGGSYRLGLTVTSTGDSFGGIQNITLTEFTGVFVSGYTNASIAIELNNSTPGTGATQVPEIDAASAASGLTLLLGSIVVLRGRQRVR